MVAARTGNWVRILSIAGDIEQRAAPGRLAAQPEQSALVAEQPPRPVLGIWIRRLPLQPAATEQAETHDAGAEQQEQTRLGDEVEGQVDEHGLR